MWEGKTQDNQAVAQQAEQAEEEADEEADFGDDFDEYAEGDEDEDFGDFDQAEHTSQPASALPPAPNILSDLVSLPLYLPVTAH